MFFYKNFLFFVCFSFTLFSFGQENTTFEVDYIFDSSSPSGEESVDGNLINYAGKSIYINHLQKIVPGTEKYVYDGGNVGRMTGDLMDNPKAYYKDFKSKYILSHSDISYQREAVLKDSLNMFSWEVTNKSKEILGYQCLEAKTHFRGRDYTAYYSPELPISDGPWKFNGLPGLILEVKSEDGRVHYEAVKLEIKNKTTEITSPFKLKKAQSWDEIIAKAKKRYQAKQNEMRQKYNAKATTTFSGVEVYDLNE